jgi:hypothetical protein
MQDAAEVTAAICKILNNLNYESANNCAATK